MTLSKLKYIARFNGYTVYDYSKSVRMWLLLGVFDRVKSSSAVTITDDCGNKYIFIDDNMPYEKQCFALAHEIGHIKLKHQPKTTREIQEQQEAEADEYAYKLLSKCKLKTGGLRNDRYCIY